MVARVCLFSVRRKRRSCTAVLQFRLAEPVHPLFQRRSSRNEKLYPRSLRRVILSDLFLQTHFCNWGRAQPIRKPDSLDPNCPYRCCYGGQAKHRRRRYAVHVYNMPASKLFERKGCLRMCCIEKSTARRLAWAARSASQFG